MGVEWAFYIFDGAFTDMHIWEFRFDVVMLNTNALIPFALALRHIGTCMPL